ncbi:MAG: hypothetical protein IT161_12295 [Bryobacterales bacterium]|nr:hypothetical protein [Bryobacterales bacterium]
MRNLLLKVTRNALLGASGLLLASASLWAQTTAMQVEIPFEFHAGSKTYPSGLYRIEIGSDQRILVLGPRGEQAYLIPPVRDFDQPNRGSGVAFRQYGKDYFLARIVSRVGSGYYEWPPSNVEKVLSKRANVQVAWVRSLSKTTP